MNPESREASLELLNRLKNRSDLSATAILEQAVYLKGAQPLCQANGWYRDLGSIDSSKPHGEGHPLTQLWDHSWSVQYRHWDRSDVVVDHDHQFGLIMAAIIYVDADLTELAGEKQEIITPYNYAEWFPAQFRGVPEFVVPTPKLLPVDC